MIRVEGPDTTAAIKRARHHTPGTVPLILETAISLLLGCPLAQDSREHVLSQRRTGAMSYGLYLDEDEAREFHFRPGEGGHAADTLHVYDRYRYGESPPVATLSSSEDVWNFFAGLRAGPASSK